ncbi:MAG: hypothetical protein Ct9H300mP1_03320 [Planctomycetaceae bacterium]|nr:MAG: hypothetical protein Ct9H300mP1_03320 [Planctomycetaceae bacterium]
MTAEPSDQLDDPSNSAVLPRPRPSRRVPATAFSCSFPANPRCLRPLAEPASSATVRPEPVRQSMMVARRLVESDVPSSACTPRTSCPKGRSPTTCTRTTSGCSGTTTCRYSTVLTALVRISTTRLLDSTLIVVMGEMGRSPKINSNAGRDHWPQWVQPVAGGGVRQGGVRPDRQAGRLPDRSPGLARRRRRHDLPVAGIDPHMTVPISTDDPSRRHGGEPIWDVIG